jgi:hypothetical protein
MLMKALLVELAVLVQHGELLAVGVEDHRHRALLGSWRTKRSSQPNFSSSPSVSFCSGFNSALSTEGICGWSRRRSFSDTIGLQAGAAEPE